MPSPSPADLLVLVVFVLLVLDSRRLRALAGSRRARRDPAVATGIPTGAGSDQLGLTLRRIQIRRLVDGEDGGTRWPDLEVLPADDDVCADGVPSVRESPVGPAEHLHGALVAIPRTSIGDLSSLDRAWVRVGSGPR